MSETIHTLKTLPEFFEAIASGAKQFEVRKNDRDYQAGDILDLREWSETTGFTGRRRSRRVTYLLQDFEGLRPGWCVMGLTYWT